jgi:hypothetical protein
MFITKARRQLVAELRPRRLAATAARYRQALTGSNGPLFIPSNGICGAVIRGYQ